MTSSWKGEWGSGQSQMVCDGGGRVNATETSLIHIHHSIQFPSQFILSIKRNYFAIVSSQFGANRCHLHIKYINGMYLSAVFAVFMTVYFLSRDKQHYIKNFSSIARELSFSMHVKNGERKQIFFCCILLAFTLPVLQNNTINRPSPSQ